MPFEKIRRLFRIVPWLLASVLAGVFLVLLHYEWQRLEHNWQDTLNRQVAVTRQEQSISRWNLTRQAVQAAQLLASDPEILQLIRAAFALAAEDPRANAAELARLRNELQTRLAPTWKNLQTQDIRILQIYFAPQATTFLRMHRPERFGDDLSHLQPLVMSALQKGKITGGAEMGRHGIAYRADVPVFAADDQAAPIAVIEVGFGVLPPQEPRENIGRALLVNPAVADNLLWDRARDELSRPPTHYQGQWLLGAHSEAIILEWMAAGLVQAPVFEQDYQLLNWQQHVYLLNAIPLEELVTAQASDTLPAAVLVWKDISAEYQQHRAGLQDMLAKWLLALLLAELVVALLWHYMHNYIRGLINDHRRQLERERDASEQSRQRLVLALASSESGFWEWDITANRAVFSPEWRQICGLSAEHATLEDGDEWLARVHPNDKPVCFSAMVQHMKGKTPMYENEYRLRTESGIYKWIYTRGKVVEWQPDGKAARMLGVYTDISTRKKNDLTILRQQAALRALNEIASLPAMEFEEQLRRSLIVGARHLGMQCGIVSQVDSQCYTVEVQVSPQLLRGDQRFSLQETPCSLTFNDGDVVALSQLEDCAAATRFAQEFKTGSYIGVPLWVDGDVYGTLSFSSASARTPGFDSQDKDFMRLLARWMGSVIAHWHQDERQRELYERLTKLSDRLPGFLYQYQLAKNGASCFPYASAGIRQIYGVSPAQASINADSIFKIVHPDDVAKVAESIRVSAAELTTWRVTYRVNHPQRGQIWVHGDAQPERQDDGSTLWHGFISDVTAAVEAERHLQETNSLRAAIFDAASVSIISTDVHGIIQTFNRGAEKMLGYGAADVVGQKTLAAFHLAEEIAARARQLSDELAQDVAADFEALVIKARGTDADQNEWLYVRRDGTRLPVLLAVSCLRAADGSINGYLGIARDISELKRTDRLKREFISTVSHELRTPLTAISGSLGLIVGGAMGNVPEAQLKMIGIAHKNSLRLNHLVNDLLDMEKLAAGKMHFDMQPHALAQLVQQAVEENAAYAEQYDVTYQLYGAQVDVQVMVDTDRFKQVMTNFLSNAAKFSPPKTAVDVVLTIHGSSVRVSVRDYGAGIPSEFRARIFQKFSQADSSDRRQKGGTGLGLAISKELVERMGGTIGFDSTPGQGANFYMDLPCVDNARSHSEERFPVIRDGKRILVVEDNHDVANLLATMLRNAGYSVDLAYTGAVALLYLTQRNYHLVTVDLRLPDMHGTELIRAIRDQALAEPTPIIVISANTEDGRLAVGGEIAVQGVDWLQKPLDEALLLDFIETALARSQHYPVRVLHIEDDPDVQRLIATVGEQYAKFDSAFDVKSAREKLQQQSYQLVILDLALPDGNGWDLLEEIRQTQLQAKVIVLSANELSEPQKAEIELALVKSAAASDDVLKLIQQMVEESR